MHIFVEKEFITNLEIECDLKDQFRNKEIQNKLLDIFTSYPKVSLYTDFEIEKEDLENSRLLSLFSNINTAFICIPNIVGYIHKSDRLPLRSIVLLEKEHPVFEKVKALGGLAFSYDNYEKDIYQLIQDVELTIDFSEGKKNSFSWEQLKGILKLPISEILIEDNFILTDSKTQSLQKNLVPFLQLLTPNKDSPINLLIFTKNIDFNGKSSDNLKEISDKRQFIFSRLTQKIDKFHIANSAKIMEHYSYNQHDRYCYSDFILITSGAGFNLIPCKAGNITLQVKTIFDKNTYKTMINNLRKLQDAIKKLQSIEVFEKDKKFFIYPSHYADYKLLE